MYSIKHWFFSNLISLLIIFLLNILDIRFLIENFLLYIYMLMVGLFLSTPALLIHWIIYVYLKKKIENKNYFKLALILLAMVLALALFVGLFGWSTLWSEISMIYLAVIAVTGAVLRFDEPEIVALNSDPNEA